MQSIILTTLQYLGKQCYLYTSLLLVCVESVKQTFDFESVYSRAGRRLTIFNQHMLIRLKIVQSWFQDNFRVTATLQPEQFVTLFF